MMEEFERTLKLYKKRKKHILVSSGNVLKKLLEIEKEVDEYENELRTQIMCLNDELGRLHRAFAELSEDFCKTKYLETK